ncbi:MAG: hypothetical protein JW787_04470 [Sedimentisphaerales bacterium]|nr:hypothetical protein [Sedimentisphaerales bacterium]
MNKKIIILLFLTLCCAAFSNAQVPKQVLLRDGLVLRGTVGKLIITDNNDTWFFELNMPVSDNGFSIAAGAKLELLPSSSLEMMIADVKTHIPATYQLWNAKVTKYKGRNYLFPSVFIRVHPLTENQSSSQKDTGTSAGGTSAGEGNSQNSDSIDSNDIVSLPPEIIEKLNAARLEFTKSGQRIPDTNFITIDNIQQELEKAVRLNHDTVLLDKNAVLVRHDSEGYKFTLDSIGRNIDSTSLLLLPCEVLERTEASQADSAEPLRYKISGVVTQYKGSNYMLLYKASQIYGHGNFGK